MRAVVDTTAFVGAVLNRGGLIGDLIREISDEQYTLIYTDAMFDELAAVLQRPRLLRQGLDSERVRVLLSLVVAFGERGVPTEIISACRDPKDDKFLEAAIAGAADVL